MISKKDAHRRFLSLWHEASACERVFAVGLLSGVALLLAYIAVALVLHALPLERLSLDPTSQTAVPAEQRLRVATLNVWNFNPIWAVRKRRIAELLDELDADVVGLQELRQRAGGVNQLDQLVAEARRSFQTVIFAPATQLEGDTVEGVGLLSRFRALETSRHSFHHLPADVDQLNRTVLRVLLDTPRGPINVFVTHLTFERTQQCQSVLELKRFMLRPEHRPGDVPQILVGDLNVYTDFQHPLELLTQRSLRVDNACLTGLRRATERIMLRQMSGVVTLRSIGTNLPLSAAAVLPDQTVAPRPYNLSLTTLFARESLVALGPAEHWWLEPVPANASELPRYTLSTADQRRLAFAVGDTHVRLARPDDERLAEQAWFVEREDVDGLRERVSAASQREPVALVLFDYVARAESELSVVRGDLVTIVDTSNVEWWSVRHGPRVGYLPASYIERVDFLPSCPPAWQAVMCRKNAHVVRLRSAAQTYLHVRVDVENATDEAAQHRRGVAHWLADTITGSHSELFLMQYNPPLEINEAELIDAPDDSSIEHAFHAHAVKDVLDRDHQLTDVWPLLHPGDPGFTFSTLPFTDFEHLVPSKGLTQRPDLILVHGACLTPSTIATFGNDKQMARFALSVFWHRLKALLFPVAPLGSIVPTDGVRLFHEPLRQLTGHELRFAIAFYVLLGVWLSWCVRRSTGGTCVGVFLLFVPLWICVAIVIVDGNPDDFHASDHAGVVADLAWSCK